MGSLSGKVALVTGAARGQGRSHCLRLAQDGADIIALDRCTDLETVPYPLGTAAELSETAERVRALGRRIVTCEVDVRDQPAMQECVADAVNTLGRLDIVIANAGIAPLEIEPADPMQCWTDVIDTNLTGAFNTAQVCIPALLTGDAAGRSIVFINSTAGLKGSLAMGTVGGYAYTAAKHALVGLTRAFAFDLAEHGIRVNTIHPAGVDTPMVNNESMAALMADRDVSAWTNLLPVGRMEPSDISAAVSWIVSEQARFVTGVSLPVDAGFTSK
ncbi:3-oxoacyl-(acyl-carrier-protein) reductase [Mycolicibacterium rhodesiae JS60]|nr:3-oxoacyl-(acyl-carrier-protein) reductase [Mycolicibacterium rhodesiae JS60]